MIETKDRPYKALNVSPENEICITGFSGKFPNCKNVNEFAYNLYNEVKYSKIVSLKLKIKN